MSEPAISAKNLSKRYRLGTISRKTLGAEMAYLYHKVRKHDVMARMGTIRTSPVPVVPQHVDTSDNSFWALKEVSFDIQPGEIVGIIGGNGAGKSTLLKILSSITEPTEGEVILNGRLGSLLEVGTGFHPELSGRENIYLNGTILGMKKSEIARHFDEIVAFSEVEQFLDTPVKRYSSGMYVRLAFAVAAHLETEILLIDEVLAVGDAKFQKKCMGKMDEAAHSGRTILFVSHNLQAVRSLCPRSILLEKGRATGPIPTDEALHHYVGFEKNGLNAFWKPTVPIAFAGVTLTQGGQLATQVKMTQPFEFSLALTDKVIHESTHISLQITDEQGTVIHHSADMFEKHRNPDGLKGHRVVTIPAHALSMGRYALSLWMWGKQHGLIEHVMNILSWDITADDALFTQYPPNLWKGITGPGLLEWRGQPSLDSSAC